jgi:hypothetical protein
MVRARVKTRTIGLSYDTDLLPLGRVNDVVAYEEGLSSAGNSLSMRDRTIQ